MFSLSYVKFILSLSFYTLITFIHIIQFLLVVIKLSYFYTIKTILLALLTFSFLSHIIPTDFETLFLLLVRVFDIYKTC